MKLFLGIILMIGTSHLTAQKIDTGTLTLPWKQYQLSNGIRVLLQPDKSVQEISVEFWVGVGTRDEPAGYHGFAHFFEHATPYGLTGDTAAQKALRALREESNAQTKKDYTRYFTLVQPAGLALALRYTADRLRADTARIRDQSIEVHRKNVINEMTRQESDILSGPTATKARYAATFGSNHPYGHSSYGSFYENERFTTNDVKQWYERYLFTKNIVLFVVGNFDEATIRPMIEKEFGNIYRPGKREPVTKLQEVQINKVVKIPVITNAVSLTWRVPEWRSKEVAALQLLAQVVHERLKTRTNNTTVSEAGATALTEFYELAGQFGVYAYFTNPADSMNTVAILQKAVAEIWEKGISKDEIQAARLAIYDHTKEKMQTLGFAGSRTELLGEGLLFANNPDQYLVRLQQQNNQTVKDIQKAAARWLKGKPTTIIYLADVLQK